MRLWLRHGCSRTVLISARYALKLPTLHQGWRAFLWGLLDNMGEREIWRYWPEARVKCAPVLASSRLGLFVVMPRCLPLEDEHWALTREEHDGWRTVGDNYRVPVEYKRGSHGLLNGRIVALDYGTLNDVRRMFSGGSRRIVSRPKGSSKRLDVRCAN